MAYTLGQAAKVVGKTKPTILAAINSGKISGSRNEHGHWQIEPSELHRVYPALTVQNVEGFNDTERHEGNSQTGFDNGKFEGLKKQVELLESERDDLRRRLDEETEERRKLTLMLTDQRQRSWLDRMLSRDRS